MTVPPGPGVRVGRDVLGQLVVGSYNVVVNATQGSSVTVRAGGPPSAQRRPHLRSARLRPGLEPLGRDRELAQLTWWLDQGVPVQVCGDSGIGKTTLLRHLVFRRTRTTEVLYLSAAGLAVDDVLQDVFEACYESDGYKPEAGELRRLMTSVQVLIVLDDFEGSVDDVGVLLDVLPACDLLFARADRCMWGEGRRCPWRGYRNKLALHCSAGCSADRCGQMSYRRQSGCGKEQVAALLPFSNLQPPSRRQNQVARFPGSLGR